MKELFTNKKRNCFLLLSSLLLCLSCSEEVIEGGATAPTSNGSASMVQLEQQVKAQYYADADVTTGKSDVTEPQTRMASDGALEVSWMGQLANSTLLTALTIPGTHLSAADLGNQRIKCQYFSLATQLEKGIRAFDIHVRHVGNTFSLYNDLTYLGKSFGGDVRDVFIRFLQNHPTETIVLLLKESSAPGDNSRSFEETLKTYINEKREFFMLDERNNITLGEARKKIVLIRQFDTQTHPMGNKVIIGNNSFSESNSTINANIQDIYNVSNISQLDYKWSKIAIQMQRSSGTTLLGGYYTYMPNTLYFNFLNGSDMPIFMANGAQGMNARLSAEMEGHTFKRARLGLMFYSFAGYVCPDITLKLIKTNMGGHYASSEEQVALAGSDGLAIHAFDGNVNTFWMTQYSSPRKLFPHTLVMNLGSLKTVKGLKFTNRKDAMPGRPERYNVEYSADGRIWIATRVSAADQIMNAAIDGEEISKAAAIRSAEIQKNIYMNEGKLNSRIAQPQSVRIQAPVSAKFIRVNFISARENTYYVHLAELETF